MGDDIIQISEESAAALMSSARNVAKAINGLATTPREAATNVSVILALSEAVKNLSNAASECYYIPDDEEVSRLVGRNHLRPVEDGDDEDDG